MRSKIIWRGLLVACVCGVFINAAHAEQIQGMREKTMKKLQTIQELFDADKFDQVLEQTQKLKESKLREYEKAQVLNIEAYVYINIADNKKAIATFEQILNSDGAPEGLRQSILTTLVQVYMMEEEYQTAFETAEQLVKMAKKPEPGLYIFKGQALYYLERYEEALTQIDTALDMATENGIKLRENWLLIKNATLFELDKLNQMIQVLRTLLELYPKDRYLTNLAALYSQLEMPEKQLALLEPLYEQGRLEREYHLINLANLYMALGTPYKAGKLLQKSLETEKLKVNFGNLELQGKAWQLAEERERAVEALKAASEHSDNGNIMVQVAYLHIARAKWKLAETALDEAFKKGGLNQPGNAYLLQGMVRFNQKHFEDARRAFIQASKFEKAQLHAEQWLKYIDSEIEKRKELKIAS